MSDPSSAVAQRADEFLAGGGDLGQLARVHDWAATSLGPSAGWPRSLTGWGNEEAREKSAESGFDLHLTKPVPMEVLRHLLEDRSPPA